MLDDIDNMILEVLQEDQDLSCYRLSLGIGGGIGREMNEFGAYF